MQRWRFVFSGHCDPYTNMAIDEAILISHEQRKTLPTLRLYGWSPPAFSLGYFQRAEEVLDLEKCKKEGVLFVRRITGGEAIFHQHELTYSLSCFKEEIGAFGSVKEGFKRICAFLLTAYKKLGLDPHFAKDIDLPSFGKGALCFASYEEYDIMVKGKKLGGNAQKRKRDLIFQHGSIPIRLELDAFLPFLRQQPAGLKERICSLEEVLGREITFKELAHVIKVAFEETFGVELKEQSLTSEEETLAAKLREEKYSTEVWNLR